MQSTHESVGPQLTQILDGAGIVGGGVRAQLANALEDKVVLRRGADQVHVVGPAGTGKGLVADVIHQVATDVLGRDGMRVDLSCTGKRHSLWRAELEDATDAAQGGTLVLRGYDALDAQHLEIAADVLGAERPMVVSLARTETRGIDTGRMGTRIDMKPLHERDGDVHELMAHFVKASMEEASWQGCRGLSRQAMADVAEAIRDVQLSSIRKMRELARDLIFGLAARGEEPLKLSSDHVRPLLEERFQQTEERRIARELARIDSLLAEPQRRALLAHLSSLHGVAPDVLNKQVEVLRDVVASIDDVPGSYRNIMTRADDVMRTGLWLLSEADTQAGFRRFFGAERFMRPTKSVAWAFYNRVFKRDV